MIKTEDYFNRQIQLWGEETQASLENKKIAIIGAELKELKNSRGQVNVIKSPKIIHTP